MFACTLLFIATAAASKGTTLATDMHLLVRLVFLAAAVAIDNTVHANTSLPAAKHLLVLRMHQRGGLTRDGGCLEAKPMALCCRRMFETAVAVGLYHKNDYTIDINPEETQVFSADDQIVALSTSGGPTSAVLPQCLHCFCCLNMHAGLRLLGFL